MQHEHLDKLNAAIFTALNEGNPVNEISDAAYHLGFTAKPSKFVQRVIELTCWGFLTWPAIQWLADALVEDFGDLHPEIVKISKAGCEGIYPSNIRRDILNFAKRFDQLCKAHQGALAMLGQAKRQGSERSRHSAISNHFSACNHRLLTKGFSR